MYIHIHNDNNNSIMSFCVYIIMDLLIQSTKGGVGNVMHARVKIVKSVQTKRIYRNMEDQELRNSAALYTTKMFQETMFSFDIYNYRVNMACLFLFFLNYCYVKHTKMGATKNAVHNSDYTFLWSARALEPRWYTVYTVQASVARAA